MTQADWKLLQHGIYRFNTACRPRSPGPRGYRCLRGAGFGGVKPNGDMAETHLIATRPDNAIDVGPTGRWVDHDLPTARSDGGSWRLRRVRHFCICTSCSTASIPSGQASHAALPSLSVVFISYSVLVSPLIGYHPFVSLWELAGSACGRGVLWFSLRMYIYSTLCSHVVIGVRGSERSILQCRPGAREP
jgi:hypothetical protein